MSKRNPLRSARFLATAALTAGGLLPRAADAELLVYDGFGVGDGADEYADGAVVHDQGHGIGWSGEWTDNGSPSNYVAAAGSIVPDGVPSDDGVLVRAGGNSNSQAVGRFYATGFGGETPDRDEVWFSFGLQRNHHQRELVINPLSNQTGSAGQFFGLYAANGSSEFIARVRWGKSSEIVTSSDSYAITLGTEYLVVGQAQFNTAGTPDVLNVYVFEAEAYDGSLPGSPTMTVGYDLDNTFNAWAVFTQNPLGNENVVVLDEFRIGESLADVAPIPEPATAVLAGLGALALAGRRRA